MRVKHLTLQGYKSFASKTEFVFSDGITAIIGPNGSGKSNIADAIRWVLGEQSMRALRGKSSSDMIFAGGHRRAQSGMAEVSLVFDNTESWLPIEFNEVTIARRAYRSGDNEYLINGSRVRLRDVSEMLAQSGLSLGGYAIIGQGLIDAALSLRAQERRQLFEEAAGIALYRARRDETLRRLDDTQRNMDRVQDIASEIAPRVRRLAREAERAEEHRRIAAHLKRLQRTWYGYRSGQLQDTLAAAIERAVAVKDLLSEHQRDVAVLSQQLSSLSQREQELRTQLRDWHRETSQLHGQADRVRRELAVAEERSSLLSSRRKELIAELESMRKQRTNQAQQLSDMRAEAERLAEDMTANQAQLKQAEGEWSDLKELADEPIGKRAEVDREIRKRRTHLEQLNQTLTQTRQRIARLENEQAIAHERLRQLAVRTQEISSDLEPVQQQKQEQAERVAAADAAFKQMQSKLSERKTWTANLDREWKASLKKQPPAAPRQTELDQALEQNQRHVAELEQALRQTRDEAARIEGEYKALYRLHESGQPYDTGVQTLLHANIEGVLGPLAALIQVAPEWESALEIAMGNDLQAVVVERVALLRQIEQALGDSGGRLVVLPLDALRSLPAWSLPCRCAADVVQSADWIRPAVEAVLGHVALCDDIDAARHLLSDLAYGSCCVLPSGTVLRADGAIVVGVQSSGSMLASERTLRELPEEKRKLEQCCDALEEQHHETSERIVTLQKERAGVIRAAQEEHQAQARLRQSELNDARTEIAVAEESLRHQQDLLNRERKLFDEFHNQLLALQQQSQELNAEQKALADRLGIWHAEATPPGHAGLAVPLPDQQDSRASDSPELSKARHVCENVERQALEESRHIADLEAHIERLSEEAAGASASITRFEQTTLGPARTRVAVTREALKNLQTSLQRELSLLERSDAQIGARSLRITELEEEERAITSKVEGLRQEAGDTDHKLKQLRSQIQPAEEEMASLTDQHAEKESLLRHAQDSVHSTESHYNQAQLEVSRCQDMMDSLARRIQDDLGLVELELVENVTAQTPLPLKPLVSQLPIVEILPEGLEDEVKLLRGRLSRLQSVNPNAPEEYAEASERHNFLTEQLKDLESASSQLHEAITELDDLIEASFRETFTVVAEKFAETFQTLFNGGSAQLELTDPQNLLQSGVDIIARPPGKRAQRLALLSGGERALTAAALLFALLQVSSTPFCVLDEVDAMLDEANISRFRALLENMSVETQFIVITHNRGTVEAAETIYGVSIDKDAVSQVVSLQLD